jgi:acetylornithine deacetylase/succinyl-diaminopimelate desuccinylase-like protein
MADNNFETRLTDLLQTSEPWFREQLRMLVEHPTVSPGKTGDEDIIAGAEAARALFESCGAQARIAPTTGTPSVIGHFSHPNPRAKILVYNHLDVQPADADNWDQEDPFRFEVEEDAAREFRYRGRGTTDDKGPALCALRAASMMQQMELPVEVVLLWETEEEIGSPNFGEVVASQHDLLKGDAVIISDTIWPSAEHPAISTGLRGSVLATLSLETGKKRTHSGLTGGAARNPIRELAALCTSIRGADFWKQGTAPPNAAELESFMGCGFDVEYFKSAHGLDKLESEVPLEILLALWVRPTFEIHGIAGGYTGPGIMSIVPPSAEAKISFRLVPDQNPREVADALRRFVQSFSPDVVVDVVGCFDPYFSPPEGPIYEAISHGMERAFGQRPKLVREGGSIGAVPIMVEELGVPAYFLPLSLPEHGYHAPNECFDWKQAKGGIEAFARTFETLARGQ